MAKPPYDIKKDPRFLARVKKLEGNQYTKLIKDPVPVRLSSSDAYDSYVIAIGLNDSYLVVKPMMGADVAFCDFNVFWTKSDAFNKPTPSHEAVQNIMVNWLMMHAQEKDFTKVRHGQYDIKKLAMEAIVKKLGSKFFEEKESVLNVIVQGTEQQIENPFHR